MKNNVDMLNGSITKGLLSMMVPVMIMNVMQILFNIVDMAVLKTFSDSNAVGAIGACGSLTALATTFLVGISTGANIIVAKRIGEKNEESVECAVMSSILLAIACGFIFMIIGVKFSEEFLRLTNCPEDLLNQAIRYFNIYFNKTYLFCNNPKA